MKQYQQQAQYAILIVETRNQYIFNINLWRTYNAFKFLRFADIVCYESHFENRGVLEYMFTFYTQNKNAFRLYARWYLHDMSFLSFKSQE